jgi:hypothetical protein
MQYLEIDRQFSQNRRVAQTQSQICERVHILKNHCSNTTVTLDTLCGDSPDSDDYVGQRYYVESGY